MSIPHIIPSKVNFDSFSSDPCDKRMGLFYYIIVKPLTTTDMLTIPINIILYHPTHNINFYVSKLQYDS